MFKDQNLIFTQFSKQGPIFTIRKWKPKDEDHSQNKANEIKLTIDDCIDSEYDKIIKGDRHNLVVVHEDDLVIAFQERAPIAKHHLVVLAKTHDIRSLKAIDEESAEHQ